jgi:hypothetical protein
MARSQEKQFGPGQSDMTLTEAFKIVLHLADGSGENAKGEIGFNRSGQAIRLIRALHVGTYNGGRAK